MDSSERYPQRISTSRSVIGSLIHNIHHRWTMWISAARYISLVSCKLATQPFDSWKTTDATMKSWASSQRPSSVASKRVKKVLCLKINGWRIPNDSCYGAITLRLSDCSPHPFESIGVLHVGVFIFSWPWTACSFSKEIRSMPRVMTHGKQMNYLIVQYFTFKSLTFTCQRRPLKSFKSITPANKAPSIPFSVSSHTAHPRRILQNKFKFLPHGSVEISSGSATFEAVGKGSQKIPATRTFDRTIGPVPLSDWTCGRTSVKFVWVQVWT